MKKTYRVYGHCTVICSMHVKAESEEEAIKIANDTFGGLTNYAGMGSCMRLSAFLWNLRRCLSERAFRADCRHQSN